MSIDLAKLEFYPLTEKSPVKDFDCKDQDLNEFLIKDALSSQNSYLSKTTLIYYKRRNHPSFRFDVLSSPPETVDNVLVNLCKDLP